ncbi:hypothetical protein AVEN_254612-1 [Araneus ventricosus]|uniref:Uncharacterized protein n=1 Tax=Araneus ventricosus TaxID=182803 RepID=A0A4Y2QPR6_ARAVE|nr:hypothetical protein AVEN_254612-1 [Araneus ventricosus]
MLQNRFDPVPILLISYTRDFRFLERAPSPPRPDFSSLTPTHIPPPNTHTGDLSPTSKDRVVSYSTCSSPQLDQVQESARPQKIKL